MSVVPPHMSTIMLPVGSVMIGIPAPTARRHGRHSTQVRPRWPSRGTPAVLDARFSTCVISDGTPMTMRGRTHIRAVVGLFE